MNRPAHPKKIPALRLESLSGGQVTVAFTQGSSSSFALASLGVTF